MRDLVFAIPGDLGAPTGGYVYARRLLDELPAQGVRARPLMLPGSFPAPEPADLETTAAAFAGLQPGEPLLVDGLAYGALPTNVIEAAGRRPLIALVHHPLGMEEGLAPDRAATLVAGETAALAHATRVVVTSAFTGRLLAERFGVPPERIDAARPGTEARAPRPAASRSELHLLAIGAVTPRKGYDLLVRALSEIADLPWRATIVGTLDRAPDHAAILRRLIDEFGLDGRVRLAGAVSEGELDRLWAEADVLVSSSLFEGYGMVLADGLARGLPIVMTRAGAAEETVPDGASAKAAPGDATALAEALRRVVSDAAFRARLAEASAAAGSRLPRWSDTAAAVAASVEAAIRETAR